MANPRRNSYSNNTDNPFLFQNHSTLSSIKQFLRKPHAFPFLLSIFLFLTWISLRLQRSSSSLSPSNYLQENKWSKEEDEKVNLVRFKTSFLTSKDKRGWLLNPVSLAVDSGMAGGAVSCTFVHVGEIRPGCVRGNHRHHTCNETFVIWGAKTLFRLENNEIVDKGYAQVMVGTDEVAVAVSPSGTAHALVNMDRLHNTVVSNREINISLPATWRRAKRLHGCINDVLAMRELLVKRFGFDPSHIPLLTDAPDSAVIPTGANIKKALGNIIDQAEAGDVLFFHYRGHGTRIPSVKPGHPFRQDEAIVPCDFNLITDVDLRQLVNRLPRGASFTILSDSCHSGGLIDKEKEQIGPNSTVITNATVHNFHSLKAIPFESILHHLISLTNIHTSDIGTHLLGFFGSDASLKSRLGPLEWDLFESVKADDGILLSGCQANETSADMSPDEAAGGKAYGAFSNAVQMVLKENAGPLSNKQLVIMARKVLEAQGFGQQHPCLYCSDHNADAPFLWQHQIS